MTNVFSQLVESIERLSAPLRANPSTIDALLKTIHIKSVRKGEHLCREGDTANALFFVRNGLLRYYYLADGAEHTGQFFNDGMVVTDVFGFTTGAPALQNIDALTDSEVFVIPRAALQAAYDTDHAVERFGRRLMEQAMAGSQRRSASLLHLTPEQRYARFVETRPGIAKAVPLYVVASYLGITPEALSRIRRRRTA